MGAAKRRGSLDQRIAQSQHRSVAEIEARRAASAELAKARAAQTPEERERYIRSAQSHRRAAALVAALVGIATSGGRR